jgi:hypothetical protein
MPGSRIALIAVLAISFGWQIAARADTSRVPLGKATILYDTSVWRAVVSGNNAVTFTCIAADCTGQPHVFATLSAGREFSSALAAARRESRPIPDDGVPPLPFPALSYWSGCRASDAPILFAGGLIGGQGFIFTTAITSGCNFGAELPRARFIELLRGFETN